MSHRPDLQNIDDVTDGADRSGPKATKRGGPEKCERPCTDCDENHHWLEVLPDFEDEDDEDCLHEAVTTHGLEAWYACKHCPAWAEEIDCGGEGCGADSCGTCHAELEAALSWSEF